MPKMIANRDVRVASLSGHVILFKEGEITPVARSAVEDCQKVGVILAPGETLDAPVTESAAPGGEERLTSIREATQAVLARNERDDFGAAGRPTARAIDLRCGFKTGAPERDTVWSALKYEDQQNREREALRRQKPTDQDTLFEAISQVIDALVERSAEDDFTRDGEPHVAVIEEFLGYVITHEERDEVWKRYQARVKASQETSTEDALENVSDAPESPAEPEAEPAAEAAVAAANPVEPVKPEKPKRKSGRKAAAA